MGLDYLYENISEEEYRDMMGITHLGVFIYNTKFELNEKEKKILHLLLRDTEINDSIPTLSKLKAELSEDLD